MGEEGKYIYGVIETKEERNFGPIGLGGEKDEVHTIRYKDLAAVVSNPSVIDYNLLDKETLIRQLATHQAVAERVMQEYTVLPIKFGTTVGGRGEVEEILKTAYREFRKALEAIDSKIELDLVALWNSDAVFREILSEEVDIKKLQQEISSKSPAETVQDRIMLGKMVALALDKKRNKYAQEILDFLKEQAEDFRINRIIADKMITNAAFLIHREEQERFDDRVNELDRRYDGKIDFRCVGPLPPYSFSTIVVERIKFETVEQARRILGLDEEATISEIKDAHRKLAFQYHPDKNSAGESKEEWFQKITQAYQVLTEYCKHYSYSFKEEDVNKSIVVTKFEIMQGASN